MTSRVVAREAPTRDRQFLPPETSSTAPLTQRASSEALATEHGAILGPVSVHRGERGEWRGQARTADLVPGQGTVQRCRARVGAAVQLQPGKVLPIWRSARGD